MTLFSRLAARVPRRIYRNTVMLEDTEGQELLVSYRVEVAYNEGSGHNVEGDLKPHLTAAVLNALQQFMDNNRTRAENELLPEPAPNPTPWR